MKKNVLVLGAGLVAKPLVGYLLEHNFHLTIATRTVSKAEALLAGSADGTAVALDLTDPEGLDSLIEKADLVISLVPYTFHVQVARRCLVFEKPLVTTSYVSNEMRELSAQAKEKGLLFLNEIGLDPGIDHMSAMRVIHHVQKEGGKVASFRSCCGGLPAPEDNDNPWGYKFSWSPRGVLLAGRNAARYLENGKLVEVEPDELFRHHWPMPAKGVGELEAYPNRDSLQYVALYGLEEAQTMFRGTLRFPLWCPMMKALVDLGWLELLEPPAGAQTLADITAFLVGEPVGSIHGAALREKVAARLDLPVDADAFDRFEWVGLFSETPAPQADTRLDVLSAVLQEKLAYAPGEKDMIVLLHEFRAEYPDGTAQAITSTLVDFGVPNGDSAMSRTVSLPCAIAARMILEGRIAMTGVHIPVAAAIYSPVLDELARLGIVCHEEFGERA